MSDKLEVQAALKEAIQTEKAAMDFYLGRLQVIGVHTLLGLSAYCVLLTGQVSLAQAGFCQENTRIGGMLSSSMSTSARPKISRASTATRSRI